MQEDPFPAADRILSEIEAVFKKDPKLKEFDIIPVTENQNKSPVLHVEHCLGLESWCIRHVYCYAYHRLMDMRHAKSRREDPSSVLRLLSGALLINPDIGTFWNMRRELVLAACLDGASELHFTSVLLSRKPKCSEAFAHRKWILGGLLKAGSDVNELLDEELRISQYASDRYPNNYHAWSHRMWCLTQLAPVTLNALQIYLNELAVSEAWVSCHVSDHSGMQYRQFILRKLCDVVTTPLNPALASTLQGRHLEESAEKALQLFLRPVPGLFLQCPLDDGSCRMDRLIASQWSVPDQTEFSITFLKQVQNPARFSYLLSVINTLGLVTSEILLNTELILRFIGHEALWSHRRFLLTLFKEIIHSSQGSRRSTEDDKLLYPDNNMYHDNSEGNDLRSTVFNKVKCSCQNGNSLRGHFASKVGAGIDVHSCCDNIPLTKVDRCESNTRINCDGIPLEKAQKLSERDYSTEINENNEVLWQALRWHETDLIEKCPTKTGHQHFLAERHSKWLSQFLGMQLPHPAQ